MSALKLPKHFDMSGKSALITGGAGLLGIQHAIALLEIGASVHLTDVNAKNLAIAKNKINNRKLSTSILDVTDRSSILELSNIFTNEGSRIDVLINNAAIDTKVKNKHQSGVHGRLSAITENQVLNEISVGLIGALNCSIAFGEKMAVDSQGGVILNIASDLSVISPDQRLYFSGGLMENQQMVKPVTYSIVKTGLIGLTRYLATYWLDKNIRCNAISPGGVFNGQNKEFVERISRKIPLGRMAHEDEYRGAIQFLCSDASSYLNGQNIVIDGGRSCW